MAFDKKPATLSNDGRSVYPGPLFNPYLIESWPEEVGGPEVVLASDYEKLLRQHEALMEVVRRGKY